MQEYSKPIVSEMGDANRLIQGSKPGLTDSQDPGNQAPANECTED